MREEGEVIRLLGYGQRDTMDLRQAAHARRMTLEREVFRRPGRTATVFRWLSLSLGAVGIGILSAGLAVFALAVILNLVFHFSPAPV